MNANSNLDYLAAKHAQALVSANEKAKDLENTLTKTLGVLQENGVYACFLYLLAGQKKKEKDKAQGCEQKIVQQMRALLKALGIENSAGDDLTYALKITESLPTLLLAKEALEQMLIYARYGAKARQKE